MPNGLLADPRGEMRATPRNKLLGLLADALTSANDYAQRPDPAMPGGKANPVLGLLADAASLNSLATTAQRASYGERLTNGLRGSKAFLKPETADVAMMAPISPRNALAALGMVGGGGMERAIFAGIGAKTADKAALAQAEKMAAAGADPKAIWRDTGWFKGGDGKWRFEIDDSGARLRDYNFTPQQAYKEARERAFINDEPRDAVNAMAPYAGMTKNQLKDEYKRTGGLIVDAATSGDMAGAQKMLADRAGLDGLFQAMRSRTYGPASSFMAHGELGAAYPDVYKLHTRIDELAGGTKAEYLRGSPAQGEQVVLGNRPTWSDDKSTMLHELQHAVQQREGFARGGNPEMFGAQFDAELARLPTVHAQVEQKRNAALDQARVAVARDPALVQKARAFAEQAGEFSASAPVENQVADYLLANDEGYRRAYKELSDLQQTSRLAPHDRYKRLAGEAEARAVQSRMNMNPQQRRELFPLDSYDVPINSLIYR